MVARRGYRDDGEEPKANPIKEYQNVDRRELSGGACVIGLGFEPRTDSLEGYCSIQLSYPTNPWRGADSYALRHDYNGAHVLLIVVQR